MDTVDTGGVSNHNRSPAPHHTTLHITHYTLLEQDQTADVMTTEVMMHIPSCRVSGGENWCESDLVTNG